MKRVNVAVLGAGGWMGKVHSLAYRNAPFYFGSDGGVADIRWMIEESAEQLARCGERS
jgi:predicted dehydrogenase